MTIKTISGAYSGGFKLASTYTGLDLTATATVGGTGVYVTAVGNVYNNGKIDALSIDNGVYLNFGGEVVNYNTGSILGVNGVRSSASVPAVGTVINNGSIYGFNDGVQLLEGGTVTNAGSLGGEKNAIASATGSVTVNNTGFLFSPDVAVSVYKGVIKNGDAVDTSAIISGLAYGIEATDATQVTNYATIAYQGLAASGDRGVAIAAGGSLTNGSLTDTTALISASVAVRSASTVVNFASIVATGGEGVYMLDAHLTNGALGDRVASITGYDGVEAVGAGAAVYNFATIVAGNAGAFAQGVYCNAGVTVTNGAGSDTTALIQGFDAVVMTGGGTVNNFGVIQSLGVLPPATGVLFWTGGALTNGSATSHKAVITGFTGVQVNGGAGTVKNFATIVATGDNGAYGVSLAADGQMINGDLADTTAVIMGYSGVGFTAGGTLSNFGAIEATNGFAAQFTHGGGVTNGAATDQTALIEGVLGVSGASSIANFGTIRSSIAVQAAVSSTSGSVVNGSNGDTNALIIGASGAWDNGPGTIVNYGSIVGLAGDGVQIAGGSVTNGGGADRSALIEGSTGIAMQAAATVRNFGTIKATGANAYGVELPGGAFSNGSVNNTTALIEGYGGVRMTGAGAGVNFGTIWGQGDAGGAGVNIGSGFSLANGSADHTNALIEGYVGLHGVAMATVANFGTIAGQGGVAVQFLSSDDVLIVEAGSRFIGAVNGGLGVLELANGSGAITGLFAGANAVVSGSMAATTFANFGTVKIDAGASFKLAGAAAVASGRTLIDAGTLSGTGTLTLGGGATTFNAGASLTVANVILSGLAQANVNTSLGFGNKLTQNGGTLTVAAGKTLNLTGAGDSLAGVVAGAGTLALTAGADALNGALLTIAHVKMSGAAVSLSGDITNKGVIAISGGMVTVTAAGATLSGSGSTTMGNLATNEITGATAASTLTVDQTLSGAGKLGAGQLTLINTVNGTLQSTASTALVIDTGTNAISNAGRIVSAGAGGTLVMSAINNTGKLIATSGVLTLNGAVSGTGIGQVAAGTLKAASTFSENVAFSATATGTLELAHGAAYSGTISGFSTASKTFLDLDDIAFNIATTKASYAGTSTKGILTVTDGAHTAKITFTGNYLASAWVLASDGHGGTVIHDPVKVTPIASAQTLGFIQALAGVGASREGAGQAFHPNADAGHAWLTAPRCALT